MNNKFNKALTSDDKLNIVNDYRIGMSTTDIGTKYHRGHVTVYKILREYGLIEEKQRRYVHDRLDDERLPNKIIKEVTVKYKPPYLCTVKDKRTGKVTNYYDVSELYVDKGYQELPEWKIALEKKGVVNFGYGYYHPERNKEVSLDKWTR